MTKLDVSCVNCGYVNVVDMVTHIEPPPPIPPVSAENTDLLPQFATVSGSEPDASATIGLMLGAILSESDGAI